MPPERRRPRQTEQKLAAPVVPVPVLPLTETKAPVVLDPLLPLKYILEQSSIKLFHSFLNTLPAQTGKVSLFVPVAPFTILKPTTLPGDKYKPGDIIKYDDYAKNISEEEEEKLNSILQHLRIIDERFITPENYTIKRGYQENMIFFTCADIKINEKLRQSIQPSPLGWRNGNDTPVILFLTSGRHVFMAIFYSGIPYIFGLNVVKVGKTDMTAISAPDLIPDMNYTNIFDMCIVNNTILENLLGLVSTLKTVKIKASAYKEFNQDGTEKVNKDGSLKLTYTPSNYLFYMDHKYSTFATTYFNSSYNCAKIISLIAPNRGINCTIIGGIQDPAACKTSCISNNIPCSAHSIFRAYLCLYNAGINEKDGSKTKEYIFCINTASELLLPYYLPEDGNWDIERHTVLEKILLRILNPEQATIPKQLTISAYVDYVKDIIVDPLKGIIVKPSGSTVGGSRKTRRPQKRKCARKTHSRRA